MELIFSKYKFKIQKGQINCIMGTGIKVQEIMDACKYQADIGFVIQPPINQIFTQTVKEQLTYALDKSRNKDEKKIINSLTMVGLSNNFLNRQISSLSSSELYKIVLASTLIMNPKILILDNINSNMDYTSITKLVNIIRTIKRRYNKTIIIFSNDSDFVHSIADYIFIIDKEKLVIKGDKYTVFNNLGVLKKCQIDLPKVIKFEKKVQAIKGINIGLRDNINDLIKDIYYFQ